MAATFLVDCYLCLKSFRSRKALRKHLLQRHPGQEIPDDPPFKLDGREASLPCRKLIDDHDEHCRYLEWLGDLVEGLNSAHIPNVPAKWYHVTVTNVPLGYISHLIKQIQSARVNSVKNVKHMKPPVWKDTALKISYKTYSMEDFEMALNEQKRVPLKMRKCYSGSKQIEEKIELFGKEALEAVKKGRRSATQKTTMRSEIIICEGEGRATRECELIWLFIYEQSKNGNLTIRIYIGKVSI